MVDFKLTPDISFNYIPSECPYRNMLHIRIYSTINNKDWVCRICGQEGVKGDIRPSNPAEKLSYAELKVMVIDRGEIIVKEKVR